jgi:hypothetical protein
LSASGFSYRAILYIDTGDSDENIASIFRIEVWRTRVLLQYLGKFAWWQFNNLLEGQEFDNRIKIISLLD